MAIDLNRTNVDHLDPAYRPLLADLQGNILKGHGRENAVHLFLRFTADPARVRDWMRRFAGAYVTSAERQLLLCDIYRRDGTCGGTFGAFLLSAAGYRALGYHDDQLPGNAAFRGGLKAAARRLDDPPVEAWESGYRGEIHAVVLLADDQAPRMGIALERVKESLLGVADVVAEEWGVALRNEKGQGIEHFGFVDGTSQPLFLKVDIDGARREGIDRYDCTAPPALVLARDPHGRDEDSYGSYVVFRKLEQDVQGFREKERALAERLGVDRELAGAYAVGRFRDGTPVIAADHPLGSGAPVNNFNYDDDPDGGRCPFHAHIRKTNPRGVAESRRHESPEAERSHRIVRRGIPFGPPALDPPPGEKVGLLFFCCQSDIGNQFEYMQGAWSNTGDFVAPGSGLDSLIGQGRQADDGQLWPAKWGEAAGGPRFDFSHFIHMRGGEYFFAPSLSFLTA